MSLRLFVALDLPAGARDELAGWADLAAPPELRRIPVANLHLTLVFLGERSAADASAAEAQLHRVTRPLDALRTDGALWLPPRRPGVLAVALTSSEALSRLHADLVAVLAVTVGLKAETRPYRPHVTVARVRRRGSVRPEPLTPPPPPLEIVPAALTLYRSDVGAGGARYEPLASVALA